MDENTNKGIRLGAGLIMTLLIIGVAITILMIGVGLMQNGGAQAGSMANNLSNQKYLSYDNTIVQGNTITSLIAQYEPDADISIVVSIGGTETQFIRGSSGASTAGEATLDAEAFDHATEAAALRAAGDKSDSGHYIAATKQFLCVVCKDPATDAITALYFTDDLS